MTDRSYHLPEARAELPLSILLGAGFAVLLFVLIALAPMIGRVKPAASELEEISMAFTPPEIEPFEEPPPPPPEEEPPELVEEELPELSLDQLDIALNPGTGGSLAGDFSMIDISSVSREMAEESFLDFSALDQVPRPIGVTGFNFPSRLLKKKVSGKIVLLLKLSADGKVLEVEVDSSTLPDFDDFVANEVRRWKFTPPTQQGRPVQAQARLPIPITIR